VRRLQRSNYTELAQAALASGDGTGWLTTYSGPVDLFGSGFGGGSGGAPPNPGLLTAYQQNCVTTPPQTVCPPAPDAGGGGGGDAGDAASDASSDAGSADAATADAGDDGGGGCQQIPGQACDDYDVAMQGLNAGSIWVTRLHADLPQAALASDLIIEANPQQTDVQNVHTATQYTVANYNPCPGNASGSSSRPASGSTGGCACRTGEGDPRSRYQDVLSLVLGGALAAFAARRRRRSSRR
jgi:MYXO-CTERM domain-containing protein